MGFGGSETTLERAEAQPSTIWLDAEFTQRQSTAILSHDREALAIKA